HMVSPPRRHDQHRSLPSRRAPAPSTALLVPLGAPPASFFLFPPRPPRSPLFPYTTLFRSARADAVSAPTIRESASGRSTPSHRRSEEHTSELQSHLNLVCRLLLEKKNMPNLLQSSARAPTGSADSHVSYARVGKSLLSGPV